MTTKEFKKAFCYRCTAIRNCLNCKYHEEKTMSLPDSMCSHQWIEHYCTASKPKFMVHVCAICDKWENKYDE